MAIRVKVTGSDMAPGALLILISCLFALSLNRIHVKGSFTLFSHLFKVRNSVTESSVNGPGMIPL